MRPNIFRYVVAHDAGVAPRPFGGYCTLAICKPQVRRVAQVGDWIVGFRGANPGQVTYVMQVEEILSFADYWEDERFASRKPGRTATPDNIYRPGTDGGLTQVANEVHGPNEISTDLSGRNVLVSRRYWYFGDKSPKICPELSHLTYRHRGHVVHKYRRHDDAEHLARWLSRWPPGVHGDPVDTIFGGCDGGDRTDRPLTAVCGNAIVRTRCTRDQSH